jgi:hypothetical protein
MNSNRRYRLVNSQTTAPGESLGTVRRGKERRIERIVVDFRGPRGRIESLLDSARCCLDAIHPEYEPWRIGVGDTLAANFFGKTGQAIERNRERLRPREFRWQTCEEVG